MNVLNRSGAIFFTYLVMYIFIFVGNFYLKNFLNGSTERLFLFPYLFLISEVGQLYRQSDWYLYKFYPIDFFDRNAQVIIIVCHAVLILKFTSLFWCVIFLLTIVINDFFMKRSYKRKAVKDLETREAWGHQNYDAEKIEFKNVKKNFFRRNWGFLLILLFLQIVMVKTQKDYLYYLGFIICIIMCWHERCNQMKMIKQVEKILEQMK